MKKYRKEVCSLSWLLVCICILLSLSPLQSQSLADHKLSMRLEAMTLQSFVDSINGIIPGKIYYPKQYAEHLINPQDYIDVSLNDLLESQLSNHNLVALFHRDRLAIIMSENEIGTQYTAQYYQALEESLEADRQQSMQEKLIGRVEDISLSGQVELKGIVTDAETSEPVIGATLLIEGTQIGAATEVDGSYTLPLTAGKNVLSIQYVGYQIQRIPIKMISSGMLDIDLDRSAILLEEVVVQAKAKDENVQGTLVGVTRLSTKQIEKLPSFLGEVDIIKGLLLQPGISTIGEGSNGFNVRGGNVDQNLIMIDEGMIFNASHALGFFSSFNSDIVSEAVLYKGTMPAIYGGRLASVLDVKIRDGSFDRWHVKGGLGLVSSRLNIDGPITPGKTSALISVRSTYSDWLLKQVQIPEVRASSAFFYDLNARVTHRFNEKNNLTLSAYLTADEFSFNNEFGFDYSTTMGQLQYRKIIGAQTLSSTNLVWSKYSSQQNDLAGTDASAYQTGIAYLKLKENINYLGEKIQLNVGGSVIQYSVDGNLVIPTSELSLIVPETLEDEKGLEWALYSDFDLKISPRLSLIGGVRYSIFQYLGPRNTFSYVDERRPTREGILEPIVVNKKVVKSYSHLQPRLSFRYNLSASSSIKGGYGRTAQYLNQIYNSETPTPTNFWQLSNQYVLPKSFNL